MTPSDKTIIIEIRLKYLFNINLMRNIVGSRNIIANVLCVDTKLNLITGRLFLGVIK